MVSDALLDVNTYINHILLRHMASTLTLTNTPAKLSCQLVAQATTKALNGFLPPCQSYCQVAKLCIADLDDQLHGAVAPKLAAAASALLATASSDISLTFHLRAAVMLMLASISKLCQLMLQMLSHTVMTAPNKLLMTRLGHLERLLPALGVVCSADTAQSELGVSMLDTTELTRPFATDFVGQHMSSACWCFHCNAQFY